MTARSPVSLAWFAAPLATVYASAFFLVQRLPRADAPGAVAVGMTLDLVVLVPAVFYAVVVRGRGWPAVTLAPVVLLSFAAASLLVPAEHHALLDAIGRVLPIVEVALVGYVGHRAWRVVRANREASAAPGDVHDRVRETLRGAFDVPAVVGAIAYEVSLLHYAFTARRPEPTPYSVSYHRASGYGAVFAAVLMAASVELVAVHVLLRMWSETAALAHLALSAYGLVWLTGDYRAMSRRPHELRPDGLRLRFGLRWDLDVAWDRVARVRRTRQPAAGADYLNTVPVGSPRYVVELREPVAATGPYGITRQVRRVGLVVDAPEAFEARLRDVGVAVTA